MSSLTSGQVLGVRWSPEVDGVLLVKIGDTIPGFAGEPSREVEYTALVFPRREVLDGVETVASFAQLPGACGGYLDADGTHWEFLESTEDEPVQAVPDSEVGAYRWLLDALASAGYTL